MALAKKVHIIDVVVYGVPYAIEVRAETAFAAAGHAALHLPAGFAAQAQAIRNARVSPYPGEP
jgi:hypothetical protein